MNINNFDKKILYTKQELEEAVHITAVKAQNYYEGR